MLPVRKQMGLEVTATFLGRTLMLGVILGSLREVSVCVCVKLKLLQLATVSGSA